MNGEQRGLEDMLHERESCPKIAAGASRSRSEPQRINPFMGANRIHSSV
ncbi:hypothetical protein [Methanoculleus receptaculi]|uniref:Uncharacterized protein n=1 Tax=Methanoculleus receptaculi TaxID=394967 RepID=A0AAX4FW81_9EURY|nr:hypothetical protein [Methanoculleus receptaculi]WOX57977.1 hypothetical protein R6Y96_01595 [Methanoculleus receptaculi]HIH86019.1 hypothetical protein [Methanoculleus sp.]